MTTQEELAAVPVPEKTDSYSPVPHNILINAVKEKLYAKGLIITKEHYDANKEGQQMFGSISVRMDGYDQDMAVGFRNSYNKTLAVGLVSGSRIIVCSNLMFVGDIKMLRKHTTNVFRDMEKIIAQAVEGATPIFNQITEESQQWKGVPLSRKQMAELAGRMFIEEELINSSQVNILKNEILGSEHFKEENLWHFYNHCTEALKKSHPANIMQQHLQLHNYTTEKILPVFS